MEDTEATGGPLEDEEIQSLDLENAGLSASSSELGTSSSNEIDSVTHTRKQKVNCVPKLIDSKRKHLEKKLTVAQRDELLIKEAKEDGARRGPLRERARRGTS